MTSLKLGWLLTPLLIFVTASASAARKEFSSPRTGVTVVADRHAPSLDDEETTVPLKDLVVHRRHAMPALPRALEAQASKYKTVSLSTIMRMKRPAGTTVRVSGRGLRFGRKMIVYGLHSASQQLFVSLDSVPLQERNEIDHYCRPDCLATVLGRTKTVSGEPGIAAAFVAVRTARAAR